MVIFMLNLKIKIKNSIQFKMAADSTFREIPPVLFQENLDEKYGSPVGDLVGKGTYGSVFNTGKGYAIKIMKRGDEDVNELDAVQLNAIAYPLCMSHPNIIKYYNVTFKKKEIRLIMKSYEGDLTKLIRGEPALVSQVDFFKSMSFQLVAAVAYLTSRGIIHGDIKPENILYRRCSDSPLQYKFVLADFDLAHGRHCEGNGYTMNTLYTLYYRPPELLVFGLPYNESAEVWALGVTLVNVFLRTQLFRGNTREQMILEIYRRIPPGKTQFFIPSTVRKNLEQNPPDYAPLTRNSDVNEFLRKMLPIAPSDRASIFALQYDPFLAGVADIPHQCVETRLVNANRCIDRINFFDRHINYISLLSNSGVYPYWHTLVSWMVDLESHFRYTIRNTIAAVELMSRYFLFNPGFLKSKLQLYAASAMYIATIFNGVGLTSEEFSFVTAKTFSSREVVDMAIEMLKTINFDLCAKTGYDEIFRHQGLIREDILKMATRLLRISYTWLPLFVHPNIAKITLYIVMKHFGEIRYLPDISEEAAQRWIKKFRTLLVKEAKFDLKLLDLFDFLLEDE